MRRSSRDWRPAADPGTMTIRHRIGVLLAEPRTVSSLAHELRLTRPEVEDHVRHLIRSARATGRRVAVEPAKCRSCGYLFNEDKITKPGKCRSEEHTSELQSRS